MFMSRFRKIFSQALVICSVVLTGAGANKINVIKAVRALGCLKL
jgi:ribosomal protein L7/L12